MLKRSVFWLLITYLALFLVACSDSNATNTNKMVVSASTCQAPACYSVTSDGSSYLVLLKPSAGAIPVNNYFDLEAQVLGKNGQPLGFVVDFALDAGMPHHNHGMNVVPKISSMGAGKFKIEGMMFHMSGQWTINLGILRGVMRERASLVVDVVI